MNVKSIRRSYNWAGLSKTTREECKEATCHSDYASKVRNVQFLTLTAQILPPHGTKCNWLSYETFSHETIMWMYYWYNVVWDVISYNNVKSIFTSSHIGGQRSLDCADWPGYPGQSHSPCAWTTNGEVHEDTDTHNNVKMYLHRWILISVATVQVKRNASTNWAI